MGETYARVPSKSFQNTIPSKNSKRFSFSLTRCSIFFPPSCGCTRCVHISKATERQKRRRTSDGADAPKVFIKSEARRKSKRILSLSIKANQIFLERTQTITPKPNAWNRIHLVEDVLTLELIRVWLSARAVEFSASAVHWIDRLYKIFAKSSSWISWLRQLDINSLRFCSTFNLESHNSHLGIDFTKKTVLIALRVLVLKRTFQSLTLLFSTRYSFRFCLLPPLFFRVRVIQPTPFLVEISWLTVLNMLSSSWLLVDRRSSSRSSWCLVHCRTRGYMCNPAFSFAAFQQNRTVSTKHALLFGVLCFSLACFNTIIMMRDM